ncbi:MAG: hypothetical protein NVS9B15_23960 [Acidobacteriaceae bacterium]
MHLAAGTWRHTIMPRVSIIVADDERVIADTLALILSSRGYAVSIAYDLEELAQKTETHCPDLILLDVQFPEGDSIPSAIQMRRRGCKVLLLSGDQLTSERLQQLDAEGEAPFPILPKPVHPEKLLETVRLTLQSAMPGAA